MTQIESTDTALRLAIVRRAFSTRRRGYDTGEVDELLGTVADLADDLLRQAAKTSRLLAEAEAELVGTRDESRELREAKAATEQLLATTRAELRADRQSSSRDSEAEEGLVVAEAEVRVLRASFEDLDRDLSETRRQLGLEQSARAAIQDQLEATLAADDARIMTARADEQATGAPSGAPSEYEQELAAALAAAEEELAEMQAQMADMRAQLAAPALRSGADSFATAGEEIAGLLRAAAEAAEAARRRAKEQADTALAEAEELATALLDDAEARTLEAEGQARRTIEAATAEAARILAGAADTASSDVVDRDVRRGLEEAANSLLQTAGEPMTALHPCAMEANSGDGD